MTEASQGVTVRGMEAIKRLERAGYSRQQIADGADITLAALNYYSRGERFPSRKSFVCLVEMAEAKGVRLTARDFIGAQACEDSVGKKPRLAGKKKV